jgi:thiol-disulfide isomerase/thioredoxin
MSRQRLNALLLTTPGCIHCNALKIILEKLLNEGLLEELEVVDVTTQPDLVEHYGIKSVPWLKVGPFEFSGAQHEPKLRAWINQLDTAEGIAAYLKQLLTTDDLNVAIRLIKENPAWINSLLLLVTDEDKDIKQQLGTSAIFEELEGSALLREMVAHLGELATHSNPKIRADIAHFLALSHDKRATHLLQQLSHDVDREVREIANDALGELSH